VRTTKDLYKLLGVSGEASQDDIRKAHRKLVRKDHPDANPEDPRAEERFKEIQQAYEVLSDPEKRREYDKGLRTSSGGGSGKARTAAGRRTGGGTTYTVDLSDLLGKLGNLSNDRVEGQREGDSQLRDEDVARVAKLLGEEISRISKLLGSTARISKYLGENVKTKTEVHFGDAPAHGFSEDNVASKKPFGASRKPGEKKVRGPRTQGKEKRVKGPRAQRERKSD
jgi:curved DNA-binding protein CbpA